MAWIYGCAANLMLLTSFFRCDIKLPRMSADINQTKKGENQRTKKIILLLVPLFVILIFAVLLFFFLKTKNKVKRDSNLNVLLVTLDTTRADRIGCYGYAKAKTPNLDFLALNGVRFSNAYSQVPLTLPSHCSILTGTYPIYHQVHNNGSYYLSPSYVTLAEVFKKRGYKTAAFVSSFTVDSRFGLDQGFEVYDDKFQEDEVIKTYRSERRADRVFSSFSTWVDKNAEQKFLCWVHFYDPHLPYDPPFPFKEEFSDSPYDGEIAYMDLYVGKIIEKLREKYILDKTLIILAGDHGEALGEKGELDHGVFIYDNTLKVPFILYCKKNLPQGMTISSRVRLIDIMPTLLEMLKVPVDQKIQGISLLEYIEGRKKDDLPSYIETYSPRESYNWSELIGLIDSEWKYIQAPKEELYNLKRDPAEEKNLIDKENIITSEMKGKLKSMIRDYSSGIEAEKRKLTLEEQEKLRSLGYLGTESTEDIPRRDLPDPKDRIGDFQIMFQAKMYEFQRDYQKAIETYNKIISLAPRIRTNYYHLALIYMKVNRYEEAAQVLKKGIENIPDVLLFARLGVAYVKLGKLKEALEANQAALRINPNYFGALISSGWVMNQLGKQKEALEYYQKALRIEPENRFLQMDYAHTLAASGRVDEALEIYNRLKSEYPNDYRIYEGISNVYSSMGDLEKSVRNFRKALALNPSPETYLDYAVILERGGNLKEAIYYLRLYLDTTPERDTPRKINAQKALARWERRLR
jgi:arylsulfatase A-like enzyme/Tfp pilus assembly protein PilF